MHLRNRNKCCIKNVNQHTVIKLHSKRKTSSVGVNRSNQLDPILIKLIYNKVTRNHINQDCVRLSICNGSHSSITRWIYFYFLSR